MCGIIGGSKKNWNYQAAIESLRHRGPDAQKRMDINGFHFGFARLSIIDTNETAMQPMVSADSRFIITFNGEIYDYKKIREELIKLGHTFKTASDTEVLLNAFVEWREEMVKHLDGIFAVVIMDVKENKLYLFRDRPGVKPLYYYYDGNDFAYASELKAIVKMCDDVSFQIDNTALYDYHIYYYIPDPKTLYKNVYKLEPASCMIYDLAKQKIISNNRYWEININTKKGEKMSARKKEDKAEELRYHLDRVIARQVVSDVPVGTFLSGGVDSSIVTAITQKHINDLTGYSIGFMDRRYDESGYAEAVAKFIKVNLKIKKFSRNDYMNLSCILPSMYDEPFADTSAYPTYFVSKLAKEDVTVVLTGDGGDEIFGGYRRYLAALDILDKKHCSARCYRVSNLYITFYKYLRSLGLELGDIPLDELYILLTQYSGDINSVKGNIRKKYGIKNDYDDAWYLRKYYHKELPIFTRMRYMDFMTYLPSDVLTKVDRASMNVSLEARVPLLDKEMIEFAFSLTENECNPDNDLKGLFKYAYKDVIPLDLLNRKKMGFGMPNYYVRGKDSLQENLIKQLWEL